jgi:flagellar biosynthesis protein FliQ
MQNGTLTNIFWGIFLIWFGIDAATLGGDFLVTVNTPLFAFGTGVLLLGMNLTRSFLRLRLSMLTMGLGAILTLTDGMVLIFHQSLPFLPELLVIAGIALVIGAFRTRKFQTY